MSHSENVWDTRADNALVFREVQRFHWVFYVIVAVPLVAAVVFAMIAIGKGGQEGGNIPVCGWIALGSLAPCVIFFFVKLVTEVRDDGLYVQLFPFHLRLKQIALEEVERFESVTYQPFAEYGGWGIRWSGGQDKAYNARGNRGVRLWFTNGKKLLIGSQQAQELAEAIGRIAPQERERCS